MDPGGDPQDIGGDPGGDPQDTGGGNSMSGKTGASGSKSGKLEQTRFVMFSLLWSAEGERRSDCVSRGLRLCGQKAQS